MKPGDKFLSVLEVAAVLGVHRSTVNELIAARRIAALQVGRSWRIRQSALDDYVAKFERRAIEAGAGKAKR